MCKWFLTNQQAHAYLLKYAERFDLNERVRLNSRVEMVSRVNDGGWLVESTIHGEHRKAEAFSHVIVASGRFNKPRIPRVKGFERFRGTISHTFDYRDNEEFKDRRVLVIGNSISGLEVASELATDPTARFPWL
jgi:dimethylaniline monooxygenase (N-oxide forming)